MNLIRTVRKSSEPTKLIYFVEELGGLFGDTNYSWTWSWWFLGWGREIYKEQELIGVGISAHPLQTCQTVSLYPTTPTSSHSNWGSSQATLLVEAQKIMKWFEIKSKEYAFLRVHDSKSRMDVIVFSDQYRKFLLPLIRREILLHQWQSSISRWSTCKWLHKIWKEAVAERDLWFKLKNHKNDKEI